MEDDILCESLLEVSKNRFRLRRELFKELRERLPRYRGPERYMLRHKAELNYLGDLSDRSLVSVIRNMRAAENR